MEYLKKDSAKANHFRRQFESTPTRSLTDCYRKPSHTKEQIWNVLSWLVSNIRAGRLIWVDDSIGNNSYYLINNYALHERTQASIANCRKQ